MRHSRNRPERSQCDFQYKKINLPRVVTIKLQDKIEIGHLMKTEPLLFNLMLKQGIT